MEDNKQKQPKKQDTTAKKGRMKRLRYHSFLAISVAVVLALVIGFNVLAGLLVDKFNWTLDFTSDSAFTLSEESKDYAKTVEIPVEIFVLAKKADWEGDATYAGVLNMLRGFTTINSKITLEFMDLDENPTFAKKYEQLTLAENDIVIASKYRAKRIGSEDLAAYVDYESYYTTGEVTYESKAENIITGSLYSVCNQTQPVVQLISGHGEDEEICDKLTYQLELNGYTVNRVNMLTGQLDNSAQFVVISTPSKDYTAKELQALDAFLATKDEYSKSLVYFADYTKPAPANLHSFLKEWGIAIGEGYSVESDTDAQYATDLSLLVLSEEEAAEPFNENFAASALMSPPTVHLSTAFEEKGYVRVAPLLSLSKGKLMVDDKTEATEQPTEFPVAILAEKVFINQDLNQMPASNVLVFGSPLHSSEFYEFSALANGDYLLNAMNTLLAKEDELSVSIRTVSSYELTATMAQVIVMTAIFAGVIPLITLVIGAVIWLRRRRK